MLAIVENVRRKQLAWVQAILDFRRWNRTELSRRAGVDPSTLSKWFSDPSNVSTLSTRVVSRIAAVGGIPAYQSEPPVAARGFAENEAEPMTDARGSGLERAIDALCAGRPGVDPWVLQSRAIETAGFMPGDVLIVDTNAMPKAGDAVCLQIYDRSGRAETAFRIFEYPFAVTASHDPVLRRPVLIDEERAQVRGVVIASLRGRLSD